MYNIKVTKREAPAGKKKLGAKYPSINQIFLYRDVAQMVARLLWEREQTPPLRKIESAKKPCNTGLFGTLQNLKKAQKRTLTTVCPTSTQKH